MAAVDPVQLSYQLDAMPSNQRAPLSNIPHALNSPIRKRSRAESKSAFEDAIVPLPKRRQLDHDHISQQERENIPPHPRTPQKPKPVSTLDFHNATGGLPKASEGLEQDRIRKHQALMAKEKQRKEQQEAWEKQQQVRATREARRDDILKWQRYYEKKFPDFVFFFDSVPEDARRKCVRQIKELGGKEERFFSRTVTHIITTREYHDGGITPVEEHAPNSQHDRLYGTINPSLLDKRARTNDEGAGTTRSKSIFDTAISKKSGFNGSPEKPKAAKMDILQKAKELDIKVWQLEKMQRVLHVMFGEADPQYDEPQELSQLNARNLARGAKKQQEESLQKLIKREEKSKSTVPDPHALFKTEQIPLVEPYIFVRCMNERTKPLFVRQYEKVADPKDGEWPQFRAVTQGKCPFIIEESRARKEQKKEKARQEQQIAQKQAAKVQQKEADKETQDEHTESHCFEREQTLQPYEANAAGSVPLSTLKQAPTTRSRATQRHDTPTIREEDEENQEPDVDETEDDPAMRGDEDATTDAAITPTEGTFSRPYPEHMQHSRQTSFDMMGPPTALPRPNPAEGIPGGEPTASGLQKSGATAAIRSTMAISSAAAQPGAKTGTTRDLHSLQRRLLDRYSTGGSGSTLGMSAPAVPPPAQIGNIENTGIVESRRLMDIAGRARADNPRAAKLKAQEKMHTQQRPAADVNGERNLDKAAEQSEKVREAAKAKREPKPGYCENCKDKFDDFEDHCESRKHRKFAADKANWASLDAFLANLERPKKKRKLDAADDPFAPHDNRQTALGSGDKPYKRSRYY